MHGVSGSVANVHAGEQIVFRFAHLQQERDNVLSYDTSSISKNVGTYQQAKQIKAETA